ncbi:peptide-methionine (R)-S-oxide reductase MsrB [Sphingobium rhizovicinum]|uniref:peptide-methionine (R)-S-oxide reductase n=1 Tax=Sphingobium rhizovicinum TaxID=432308 RepID=A0ABV7NAE6_9SPHN
MNRRHFLCGVATGAGALALWQCLPGTAEAAYPFALTDTQWKARLSPWAYKVLRQQATEYPGTSPLNEEHRAGTFACAGCGQALFSSKTKFDSGTGWPSFWATLPKAVGTSRDLGLGEVRTEVHCARCGGHLGHVFDDGPRPTGKRYCMNGVAMKFSPA